MARIKRKKVGFWTGVERFLRYCSGERGLSEKTQAAYRSDLRWFSAHLTTCRSDVSGIGNKAVLGALDRLKHEYMPRSVRRKIAVFRSFMRYLEREKYLAASPFRTMEVRIRPPDTLPRCLRPDALRSIVRCVGTKRFSEDAYGRVLVSCVVNLLLFTGVRVSELVGLDLGDVADDGASVVVFGKGSRERCVPVADSAASAVVRRYLRERQVAFPESSGPDAPFLLGRCGRRMTDQAVRASLRSLAAAAGVSDRITPHMFRHTFASLLSGAGVDIRAIQLLLGHRSILTTQIYSHVSGDDQREILEKAAIRARMTGHR